MTVQIRPTENYWKEFVVQALDVGSVGRARGYDWPTEYDNRIVLYNSGKPSEIYAT